VFHLILKMVCPIIIGLITLHCTQLSVDCTLHVKPQEVKALNTRQHNQFQRTMANNARTIFHNGVAQYNKLPREVSHAAYNS